MVATWCKSCEVTSPNTVLVDGVRPVYFPYCPLPGKEQECESAVKTIISEDGGICIVTDKSSTSSPLIYDARRESDNKPISDILVANGLAIKWNIPSKSGSTVEFSIL